MVRLNSQWIKIGAGGSYDGWVKVRNTKKHKGGKTAAQSRIAEAGRQVAKECKGKKGSDFTSCRAEVVQKFFHK